MYILYAYVYRVHVHVVISHVAYEYEYEHEYMYAHIFPSYVYSYIPELRLRFRACKLLPSCHRFNSCKLSPLVINQYRCPMSMSHALACTLYADAHGRKRQTSDGSAVYNKYRCMRHSL